MMKRILIYYGENKRAVDQQSVMELFRKMGHEVFLLTTAPRGDLHELVEPFGVKTFTHSPKITGPKFFYTQTKYLLKFIKDNKIDVVIAHLQGAGLIASIARRFHKFEVFYVRHNMDAHFVDGGRRDQLLNKLVNLLAPKFIAVSTAVEKYLIEEEKINPKRIRQINNAFNFEQYSKSDYVGNAAEIRAQYPARLLLLDIGRLIPFKRHPLMIKLVHELRLKGFDAQMVILGVGDLHAELKALIDSYGLQDSVHLAGRVKNVLDHLEAADILVHFSQTEALNTAVLEAGLMKRPVIVCENVGTFSTLIKHGENGFLVDKDDPITEAIPIIEKLYKDPELRSRVGNNLNKTVIDDYDIKGVVAKYEALLSESD